MRARAAARGTPPQTSMRVRKRSGAFEPVDVDEIVRAVGRYESVLRGVDSLRMRPRQSAAL